MNGIKHDKPDTAPSLPPKQTSAATLTEKALPPIEGALHSAKQILNSTAAGKGAGEYPVPQSHADTQVADYVLVFQHVPKKYLRAHAKVPSSERAKIAAEYDRLIERIRSIQARWSSTLAVAAACLTRRRRASRSTAEPG